LVWDGTYTVPSGGRCLREDILIQNNTSSDGAGKKTAQEVVATFSILHGLSHVALNPPYGWIQKERHD